MPAKGCGQSLGCFGAIVFAIAAYGMVWGYDAYFAAPWAHSIGGRPTLTGRWAGTVSAHASPGGGISLEIIRGSGAKRRGVPGQFDISRINGWPLMHGTATWCPADGTVHEYTLRGLANHRGDSVTITFAPRSLPNRTSQELLETRGSWDGSTNLVLAGLVQTYLGTAGHTRQSATAPDTLTLHPAPSAPGTSCGPGATAR